MSFYLNTSNPFKSYKKAVKRPYYIDKSDILNELIPLVEMEGEDICITRPRRFGKTMMAQMIASFFEKGNDSSFFDELNISKNPNYLKHRNQHNVFFIDLSYKMSTFHSYDEYICFIQRSLQEDLHEGYPAFPFKSGADVFDDLNDLSNELDEKFIFVIDEWDAIFHQDFTTDENRKQFILFLHDLLKDKNYVEFTYMTGILPIRQYASSASLNMFKEYTMTFSKWYNEYFGFTDEEVDLLYQRYLESSTNIVIDREGLREWYDGYYTKSGEKIYNPRSVVYALEGNELLDYWTKSGPFDDISYYIKNNVGELKDDISRMLAGQAIRVDINEKKATLKNTDDVSHVYSTMVVYGYLTYDGTSVSIPNRELMNQFIEMVKEEKDLGYVYRLARESDRMLKATLDCDTETMCEILQLAHDSNTSDMKKYNREDELAAVVNLCYLSANDDYFVKREDPAGVGYADFVLRPRTDMHKDAIIIALKVNATPEEAIQQIKDRKYIQGLLGKTSEKSPYKGRILAVGISYCKDDPCKKHACKVEVLRDKL